MASVTWHDARQHQWLEFSDPIDVIRIDCLADVRSALVLVEQRVNTEQLWAAGFVSYDAAPAFDHALASRRDERTPLLWFGLFREPARIDRPDAERTDERPPLHWSPDITRAQYDAGVAAIKSHIAEGDSYQVNYTFRLRAAGVDNPWPWFCALVEAQPSGYGAFVDTGDITVCSVSPELFFDLDGRSLVSRPMKGTARRGRSVDEDLAQAAWLHASEKNRAENVMIVDMIRNDIGRVADVGSVRTSQLFHTERYPTVWQMTSTVEGETDASGSEIVAALFPCASITGAPKARTSEIIAALEHSPRGLYTGAIGFIAPHRRAQFSVAIRTAVVDQHTGEATYGVGGGVTWESQAGDEYDECLAKALVLTKPTPDFCLLETIRWSSHDGYTLLDRHLERLRLSADYFDIPFNAATALGALERNAATLVGQATDTCIVRLLIDRSGQPRCESLRLIESTAPVRLQLARTPVDTSNTFLFHKTTHRWMYEQARAACPDADDVLLWNARGEVTETTIANVVVELDGQWVTPPVTCGLLAGTMRAELLALGSISERVITLDDLQRATRIEVINSVRGRRPAVYPRVGAPS